MDKKEYKVKMKFVFNGEVDVMAENRLEAMRIANESCGMSFGGIHTSSTEIVDYEFDMTPTKILR